MLNVKKSTRVLLCLAVLAALLVGAAAAIAAYGPGPGYHHRPGPGYHYGPPPGHRPPPPPPPPGYGPYPGHRPPPPPPRPEWVWVMPGGQAYHHHWCKFVSGLRGLIRLPRHEARRRGYRHCRTCFRY